MLQSLANERRCRPITHLTAANCEQPSDCLSKFSFASPLIACFLLSAKNPGTFEGEELKISQVICQEKL